MHLDLDPILLEGVRLNIRDQIWLRIAKHGVFVERARSSTDTERPHVSTFFESDRDPKRRTDLHITPPGKNPDRTQLGLFPLRLAEAPLLAMFKVMADATLAALRSVNLGTLAWHGYHALVVRNRDALAHQATQLTPIKNDGRFDRFFIDGEWLGGMKRLRDGCEFVSPVSVPALIRDGGIDPGRVVLFEPDRVTPTGYFLWIFETPLGVEAYVFSPHDVNADTLGQDTVAAFMDHLPDEAWSALEAVIAALDLERLFLGRRKARRAWRASRNRRLAIVESPPILLSDSRRPT